MCFHVGTGLLKGIREAVWSAAGPCLEHVSADAVLNLGRVTRQRHCGGPALPLGPDCLTVVLMHSLNRNRARSLKLAGRRDLLRFWWL